MSEGQAIFVKAAGPVISLLIGNLFLFSLLQGQSKRHIFFVKLYFCSFGYIGFFGYLLIAPFFTGGDTGYIQSSWISHRRDNRISIAGTIILFFIMKSLMQYFAENLVQEKLEKTIKHVKKFISSLF